MTCDPKTGNFHKTELTDTIREVKIMVFFYGDSDQWNLLVVKINKPVKGLIITMDNADDNNNN